MRWCGLFVLGGALLCSSGCIGFLRPLIAPEDVVAEGATSLADAGARTLSDASLDDWANINNTVDEIDRILQENPDAVNVDQLKSLRDNLKNSPSTDSGPDQRQVMKEPPKPRRPTDTTLPRRKSDNLAVLPPGEFAAARRMPARPDTLPDGSSLRPDPRPVHMMSLKPVRLSP